MALKVQLNEYETDQYIFFNFQCTTMLIYAFCKICEHEREIVFALILITVLILITIFIFRTISGSGSGSGSQLLQNKQIIKQTVVLLSKNCKEYGSVSYLFSCTYRFLKK